MRRIWHAYGLNPHLIRTFKLSRDSRFAEKLEANVGLYVHASELATVPCDDEKSQIQSLDRTQSRLPLKKGRSGSMAHNYKRNGPATLFAPSTPSMAR